MSVRIFFFSAGLLLMTLLTPLAGMAQEYAFLNAQDLARNKQLLKDHRAAAETQAAWQQLKRQADKALTGPLLSVTDKTLTPPGGSKHDYLSLSAYWWPDNTRPDGLPWVRRDGRINPASKNEQSDGVRLAAFTARVQALTLAWYFSDDQRYADRAILLIRHWFIDPASRMNPNLNYAQGVPGIADGRRSGVLDGRYFATRIVDALIMLRQSPAWRQEDERQMQAWMTGYLHWLLTSKLGKGESQSKNNHGSWYSTQVAGIAWYLQRPALIKQMVSQAQHRLDGQLVSGGKQPFELARSRSFHYSWFNLQALTALAQLAQRSDAGDLWCYQTAKNESVLSALDYLAPWSDTQKPWPWPSLDHVGVRLVPLMSLADNQLANAHYESYIRRAQWQVPAGASTSVNGAVADALRDTWLLSLPAWDQPHSAGNTASARPKSSASDETPPCTAALHKK